MVHARPNNMFVAGFLGSPSMNFVRPDLPHNVQATLGLIEPMGATELAWLDAQGTPLAMQVETTAALTTGAGVNLALDMRHVSLFDATSERRL